MRVQVHALLPFALGIEEGSFPPESAPLLHAVSSFENPSRRCSVLFWEIEREIPDGEDAREGFRARIVRDFLQQVNRMIRWYRVLTEDATLVEITPGDVGKFSFLDAKGGEALPPFLVEPEPQRKKGVTHDVSVAVRKALENGDDPPVEELVLLDAENAFLTGRFREAVLHSWAVIDTMFTQHYTKQVESKLTGEYAEGRKFVAGHEIPMKVRMSAMLYLLSGRSFFREPGLWDRLAASYDRRNAVVHRAEAADKSDARNAIAAARQILTLVNQLAAN